MKAYELFEDKQLGHVVNSARKAHAHLSSGAADAIENWQAANWETGSLAQSHGDSSSVIHDINTAFEPVRQELKKQFGDTIPLSRGEKSSNSYSDDRKLYSWTYDEKIANQFAGNSRELPVLSDEQINQLVAKYEKDGYITFFGYKILRNKQQPEYYSIYNKRNEMITDGDDIKDFIEFHNDNRKETNAKNVNNVYTENIPIDKIVWVTNQLGSKEFIVAQAPKRK